MKTKLISLLLTALILLPVIAPVIPVFAEDITTYLLDASTLPDVPGNSKENGDTDTGGTKSFFTIHYKAATRIESTANIFDGAGQDGFSPSKRINLQGKMEITNGVATGAISFTTQGPAEVKVWWGCGDTGRQMSLIDASSNVYATTSEAAVKNGLYISTLNLDKAGTYYLGGLEGSNYIYKVAVKTKTLDLGPRADWSTISAPKFVSNTTTDEGRVQLEINAVVGHNGADNLVVNMYQDGKVISTAKSTSYKSLHKLSFSPVETGTYTFEAIISREGEESKTSELLVYDYVLPLEAPYVTNCANLGNGVVNVIWNPVREAESYNVYVNGEFHSNTTDRDAVITGLTNGSTAKIEIEALRGNDISGKSNNSIKVGKKDIAWNFTVYGPSAKKSNNVATVNSDGSVTLKSLNGSGKLQPTGADGLGFYYTAVPADQNFTFTAKVLVNYWTFSNGQEGFGLMVTDHVPSSSDTGSADFWTNQYMAACTKIEYRYEDLEDGGYQLYTTDSILGYKYSMKLGVGSISKIGIDQSILDRTSLGETGLIVGQNGYLKTVIETLECRAGFLGKYAGTYNIIGNCKNEENLEGNLDEYLLTELTLEIQKNNTGYFITYYDKNGDVVRTVKNYEPDALESFDSDYVYVGMFAARNASVTFKDIKLTTIDPAEDAPAEERPIQQIIPTVTVTSSTASTSTDYELIADFNLDGIAKISLNGKTVMDNIPVKAYERLSQVIDISNASYELPNTIRIEFTPSAEQNLPEYTEVSTYSTQFYDHKLTLYKGAEHRKNIYVSPNGLYNGNGSKEHPYDIFTAVDRVVPGQTIILMEGTYKLETGLKIQRGTNGTQENPIRMIADPEAKTRPIIDFKGMGTGILHGGDWWYFYGFDVTNSLDGQKGFQISGNNNVLDQIHTYYNGNTGIQLSRYATVDLIIDQWPANNLILNCTSWGNADSGYEDADGFAAKLTIGEGNVFDGCIAYNNADDGWDLYAKVATGSIGSVTIKNCIAYANGYLEDGTVAGNGNGFKMGGDSLSGQHQLINSIAFNNRAKGIDSNSCPDIIVKNCISYNNGSHNVALYTNSANNTDFVANGIISFKDNKLSTDQLAVKENFKPKGNQDVEKYQNESNFYWNGETSINNLGESISADIFVSLEFTGFTRNSDGSINRNGFLELNEKAPSNAGTDNSYTPTKPITLVPNEDCNYSEAWTNTDSYVHWHECECGDKADIGNHEFVLVIDREATKEVPGLNHYECSTCGHKLPQNEYYLDIGTQQPPNIFEDFGGWLSWLFQIIIDFFASLFGGKS